MPINRKPELPPGIFEPVVDCPEFERILIAFLRVEQSGPVYLELVRKHSKALRSAVYDDAWMRLTEEKRDQIVALFANSKKVLSSLQSLSDEFPKIFHAGFNPDGSVGQVDTSSTVANLTASLAAFRASGNGFLRFIDEEVSGLSESNNFRSLALVKRSVEAYRDIRPNWGEPTVSESANYSETGYDPVYKFYALMRPYFEERGYKLSTPKVAMGNYLKNSNS